VRPGPNVVDAGAYDRWVAETEALLGAGREALENGDWPAARDAFGAAVERDGSAEALIGLAQALWWLEDVQASLRHRERAYAALRRRPDPVQAAAVAMSLCVDYGRNLGNLAAARGWLGRAARLVEEAGLAPMEGWITLGHAALAYEGGDVQQSHDRAREALELARRSGDADLELCALSHVGGSLVAMGHVAEGTALLDEAMAGALGGEGRPDTVVYTSCVTIVSCNLASELTRALQWIRAAEEFNRRYGSSHLYAVCRTHYGSVLFAAGRWDDAERELEAARHIGGAAEPVQHARALAKLAELRVAQGRTEEAARLLDGLGDRPEATFALAALRVARGELAAAATVLRRRLRAVGEDRLGSAALLELLVEVEIGLGDADTATARAQRLVALGEARGSGAIAVRGERALGRALTARGDASAAVDHLERALEGFARLELPLETGRARLLLAAALAGADRPAAIAEARDALQGFEALGAARDADAAAALLRSLGVKAARSGPKGLDPLTKREREILALLGEGLSNRDIAARLFLSPKTVENHVASVLFKLELTGRAQAAAYAVRHLEQLAGPS
jgi:DNA-binding CsgD family transcriptional regulator